MHFKINKKLILLGLIVLIYTAVLLVLYTNRQRDLRGRATPSTTLSFTPNSTTTTALHKQLEETFPLDVIMEPGTNAVSFVSLDINYDSTKLTLAETNPVSINTTTFVDVVEGPVLTPGNVKLAVSIGANPVNAVTEPTRVVTLNFKGKAVTGTTPAVVSFQSSSAILSIGSDDQGSENVLSESNPAYITISTSGTTATPTQSLACESTPADVLLIIDNSGSMNGKTSSSDSTPRLTAAKNAAKVFVDQFNASSLTRIGLVKFSSTQQTMSQGVDQALTTDYATVKSKIGNISLSTTNGTCIECALVKAGEHMASQSSSSAKKAFILLTDGRANATVSKQFVNDDNPGSQVGEKAALDKLKEIAAQQKMVVYTIGLGTDVNADFLQEIATHTGGKYYFPASAQHLQEIYQEISRAVTKGAISGSVFNDANNNNTFDPTESKLPNWDLRLLNTDNSVLATTKTNSEGDYFFDNLCNNRTYRVDLQVQTGWGQTSPKNPAYYEIPIKSAVAHANKNFGVINNPQVRFNLITFLHGIGNSGDNSNPTAHSLSNKNPLRPERPATILLLDHTESIVATISGKVKYVASEGRYTGTLTSNSPAIKNTNYIIKVYVDGYLRKRVGEIQLVSLTNTNSLPVLSLVTGDTNTDNRLNILDYNAIIDCYSDTKPARSCADTAKKLRTDINDDGPVNQRDYNLFLRELAVQNGD